jgi:hypothetical protein
MMLSWLPSSSHRRKKPFLLLDARPLNLHLYSVEAQQDPVRLRLLSELAIVPRDMNSTLKAIDEVLSRDLPFREIAVVMNSPLIHHQMVVIPPMREEERRRILQREINRVGNPSREQDAFSYWSFGKQQEAGRYVERVLCAQMPRHLADAVVEVLEQKNLQPIALTSHSQMVCHLMRDADVQDVPNVALVEVNEWDGMITLFRAGVWTMERRFLTGNPTGRLTDHESEQPTDLGQLLLEMGRAFQYFKQQFRNENIGRILIYGSSHNIDAICEALQTSFDLQVSPFADHRNLFDMGAIFAKESQPSTASLYNIPCSAALHGRFEKYIDFLPERIRKRRQVANSRRVVCALGIVLYCWLGLLWWIVSRETGRDLEKTDRTPAKVTAVGQPADQNPPLTEQRTFVLAALQSQEWLQHKHEAVGALVREIAERAPDQMRITSFQAFEREDGWEVSLEAEIRSPNGTRSQEMLTTFRSQCRSSSYLSQMRLSEVTIADSESTSGANTPRSLDRRNLLTFSMAGHLNQPRARRS